MSNRSFLMPVTSRKRALWITRLRWFALMVFACLLVYGIQWGVEAVRTHIYPSAWFAQRSVAARHGASAGADVSSVSTIAGPFRTQGKCSAWLRAHTSSAYLTLFSCVYMPIRDANAMASTDAITP